LWPSCVGSCMLETQGIIMAAEDPPYMCVWLIEWGGSTAIAESCFALLSQSVKSYRHELEAYNTTDCLLMHGCSPCSPSALAALGARLAQSACVPLHRGLLHVLQVDSAVRRVAVGGGDGGILTASASGLVGFFGGAEVALALGLL